jgi:hypothetical protein
MSLRFVSKYRTRVRHQIKTVITREPVSLWPNSIWSRLNWILQEGRWQERCLSDFLQGLPESSRGPRDHWVNVLTHLAVDHGFSTFVLWGVPTAPQLRMFIDEIAPAVKERVADVRARG